MITITEEDRQLIRKFAEAKNRAYRVSASEVTKLYNRILNKTARPTTCGSCVKNRINDLERWLNQYEADERKELEKQKQQVQNVEEVKEEETKPKKKRGRPKKTE